MKSFPLDPETLLAAYAQGVFPMADRDGTIRLYTADPRGVLPLDGFHVPQTLRQLVRKTPERGGFEVRINHDFEATMRGCMARRPEGSWINTELIKAYLRLHDLGYAHSVESCFGERSCHRERDASKVAWGYLVERLRERKFELLDTQATTSHLRKCGCVDIPAREYLVRLRKALATRREFA